MTTCHIALPVLNEFEQLPAWLNNIENQSYTTLRCWICVNQPDRWWDDPETHAMCDNNQRTLKWLEQYPHIQVIDASTKGKGWPKGKEGIGQARHVLMAAIMEAGNDEDVILCMDADTEYPPDYVASIVHRLMAHPRAVGMAVPYLHKATGDETLDRLMLRYEIYLRHYLCEMFRITSPYTFTALGSAMATQVKHCKAIGGLTPKKSGEDFYFLQKLRKYGPLLLWNDVPAYPAARYSNRVGFGTGPALIKGRQGEWSSYPIYRYADMDDVKHTMARFEQQYTQDMGVKTACEQFLSQHLNQADLWGPLRKNAPTQAHFVRACHERLDGLRILQFLKASHANHSDTDEERFMDYVHQVMPDMAHHIDSTLSFEHSPLATLETIRDALMTKETAFRQASDQKVAQAMES